MSIESYFAVCIFLFIGLHLFVEAEKFIVAHIPSGEKGISPLFNKKCNEFADDCCRNDDFYCFFKKSAFR